MAEEQRADITRSRAGAGQRAGDLPRQIMKTASDAVVTINENHEVVFINAAAVRMFGYARREILGGGSPQPPPHPPRAARAPQGLRRALRPHDRPHRRADRRALEQLSFPVSISFSVAEIKGQGPPALHTAILRDLSTPQRSLEEQVKRAPSAWPRWVTRYAPRSYSFGGFARQLQKEATWGPAAALRVGRAGPRG